MLTDGKYLEVMTCFDHVIYYTVECTLEEWEALTEYERWDLIDNAYDEADAGCDFNNGFIYDVREVA